MFDFFDDLSKGMKSMVAMAGDVVAGGIAITTGLPTAIVTMSADAMLGEKNAVSETLEYLHGGFCDVTDFAVKKVAAPIAGSVLTIPVRKMGAATRLIGGMGQVTFTENSEEGLKNISKGLGTLGTMALAGFAFSEAAETMGADIIDVGHEV